MSSQFLPLEEAAKKLGISSEKMVQLRSEGKIRGFRDGASWKFPENELDRLAEELANESDDYDPYKAFDLDDDLADSKGGSGILVDDLRLGSRGSGNIIGGDSNLDVDDGSDVGVGSEPLIRSGSDVDLIAGDSNGSDVRIISSKFKSSDDSGELNLVVGPQGLVEIDSGELQLSMNEPVITHDSAVLDLAMKPNAGSTGPVTKKELKAIDKQNPNLKVGKNPAGASKSSSGLDFDEDDEDSDDDVIGLQSDDDMLGSGLNLSTSPSSGSGLGLGAPRGVGASSLELMDDLDMGSSPSNLGSRSSRGVDVLSELDLLSADAGGSGLITGDSGNDIGGGSGKGSKGSGFNFDDALADDDDLVIADDEDDLVLGGSASDVSVSGDSGINLMSPSDSGLSLESEPLDLAGSSISALDLGAEIGEGGSGSGSGSGRSNPAMRGRKSAISFDKDEDFNLSPSGVGIEADDSSQVIEIEDSSAFADADAFGDAEFGEAEEGGFAEEQFAGDGGFAEQAESMEEEVGISAGTSTSRSRANMAPVYEVPFSIFQVSMLLLTLSLMCVGGMLMTDLLRNMWAYTGTEAPVSSLTDALISLAGLDG